MDPPSSATPTPYAGAETASKPWETLTDLASVDGNHLSRLPETEVRAKELSGQLYSDIFRRLQIRPGKYEDFYNGVVRFIRNKHVAEIKRGTNASFTYTSRLLLRAFGYIVWPPGSEWLIDDADLSAGEVRLTYSRKKETAHQDDTGFYTILETLWQRMRNILFVQRPATAPRRRGRRRAAATPSEDLPDGMIYRHATNVPNHVSTFDRARINTSRKLNSLSDTMPAISPSNRQYTYEETDKSIVDLIVRLHEVRSRSDARIFASLWEERIMRIDELEDVVPTTQDDTPTPWAIMPGDAKSLSNEPFMSHGVPIRDAASIIPPTLPRVMSIWISTSRLPTISLSAAGLPTVIHSAAPGQLAYHWVDAPVENADMARFFEGVNWRVEPNASDILGYIFSYGWNDLTRFVSTGRFETHEQTKGNNGCTEHGFRKEAGNNKRLKNVTMEKAVQHKGPDVHFPVHQWQVIGVGWRDFQNDLKDAARKGVKVWRMKVCVVEMPTAE